MLKKLIIASLLGGASLLNAMQSVGEYVEHARTSNAESLLQKLAEKLNANNQAQEQIHATIKHMGYTSPDLEQRLKRLQSERAAFVQNYQKRAGLDFPLDVPWRALPTRAERRQALLAILNDYKQRYIELRDRKRQAVAVMRAGGSSAASLDVDESFRRARKNLMIMTGLNLSDLSDVQDLKAFVDTFDI